MSGLTPQTATTGVVTLGGVLGVPNGGLNTTSTAVGAIPIGISTAAYSALSIGANGTFLGSNGTTASWQSISATAGVNSWSAGTTGLLPNNPTGGNIVLTGTLATANGGTGLTTIGTAGQVLTVNPSATGLIYSSASSGGGITPTATKTTNYTAISGDYVVLNVSSAAVVTMPASPTNGATVGAINLATSTASVTFAAGAGATMNNTSVVLNSNQDAVWVYNSNTTSWLLIDWNATNEYQIQGIMGFY